jgi:hypothetical protein
MRYQDVITEETKQAFREAMRYAKAVPADKVEWSPLDSGRTVLDQAREMAKCPDWAASILSTDVLPSWDEASMAATKAEMAEWTSIDQCEAEGLKRLEKLFEVFDGLPDAKLTETKWLPFDGGRDFTYQEITTYPRWNFNYHCGQIAYIQTLFGDKEMH